MKIVCFYSMKGGVGKTTTTVNLAYIASAEGARTLICDLDPQGASSYYFRIKASKKYSGNKFIKGGKHIDKNIKGTDYDNLDLLPSKLSYRKLDLALNSQKKPTSHLKLKLEKLKNEYDYIFVDCAPTMSLISENIFECVDYIFTPLIPTTLSVRTYLKLLKFFKNNSLNVRKINGFFTMVEKRKKMHQDIIKTMLNSDRYFLNSSIPYRSDVENMGIRREPLIVSLPKAEATKAYIELWKEIKKVMDK